MSSSLRFCVTALFVAILFSGCHREFPFRETIDLTGKEWTVWLDQKAEFKNDKLYLGAPDVLTLPVNEPGCGWDNLFANAIPWTQLNDDVAKIQLPAITLPIPATIEEYFWDVLGGDYQGVSWWGTNFELTSKARGKRIILSVEATRMRCEVFVNRQLVGYNLLGMLPFKVDITDAVGFEGPNQLVLRITDAMGNFGWTDLRAMNWGDQPWIPSHGFGGIMGKVQVNVLNDVNIDDIFVMNKPSVKEADIQLTLHNSSDKPFSGKIRYSLEPAQGNKSKFNQEQTIDVEIDAGAKHELKVPIGGDHSIAAWSLEQPNLYNLKVELLDDNDMGLDTKTEKVGFRWFKVEVRNGDKRFYLNDKRIVLRTSISWGYYGLNGIYPTPELAELHISQAKELGLNMLNFHRGIGMERILDEADRQGLLLYAEPGGYTAGRKGGDSLTRAAVREKYLRMVKHFRNHPSLVLYNMINEQADVPDAQNFADMRDAHAIDPTRIFTYVSGWLEDNGKPDRKKLHMLPYDTTQYITGWYDFHHARGWGSYQDVMYVQPQNYYLCTDNAGEIIYYGEEGAHASPPRFEKFLHKYDLIGRNGWDGEAYKKWYHAYVKYLKDKGWENNFSSIDELTVSLANIQYYYQGRAIENVRISNIIDGYAVNGYESERNENHSGIVDAWRNIKGDASILRYYNQPLYIALKCRTKVVATGDKAMMDAFIVNEKNINGSHTLVVDQISPDGSKRELTAEKVQVIGDEEFGQLLLPNIPIEKLNQPGYYTLIARLLDERDKEVAQGREQIFAVNWTNDLPVGNGAIIDPAGSIKKFSDTYVNQLAGYTADGAYEYLILASSNDGFTPIPNAYLRTPAGDTGLAFEAFDDFQKFSNPYIHYTSRGINYDELLAPIDTTLNVRDALSFQWKGFLVPKVSGVYQFDMVTNWRTEVYLNEQSIPINRVSLAGEVIYEIELKAGKKYPLLIKCTKEGGRPLTHVSLKWRVPAPEYDVGQILAKVDKGMTLVVLSGAHRWAKLLSDKGVVTYLGALPHGHSWLGGSYFGVESPYLDGLPVDQAFNWEYQSLVRYYGPEHNSMLLEGEKAFVASVTGHEHAVGTALAEVSYGNGKIILTTLDIAACLESDAPSANVGKKIFVNMLKVAAE